MAVILNEQKLLEILLHEHYLTEEDAKQATAYAAAHRGSIREYLINHNIVTRDLIGQAIAELYFIPYADLSLRPPTREQVLKIPDDIARKYRVVLYKEDDKGVTIATDVPNQELWEPLRPLFPNKTISFAYGLTEDIDAMFLQYVKSLSTRFSELVKTQKPVAPELLSQIFADALAFRASDIHIEPQEDTVLVRFRIDGVLREAGSIPKDYYEPLVNRVKVLAHLRIDEHSAPQDGAIRTIVGVTSVDLRVSLVPTLTGENIVLRLLSSYVQSFALADLGMSVQNQNKVADASRKPFGMILVTGPTGSGKTTTLYAILKLLNRPDINITTIEDPVEYRIEGISQIQVNPATDLTFAKGLKTIIRQDPNIILVGEIRDNETAEIAVNAALTGHLMLSTFHANDAATAIPRLLDMHVEPFLLASTVEIILAQRLVRKICEACRVSQTINDETLAKLPEASRRAYEAVGRSFYRGKGCAVCGGTGFKGRTAIFEVIQMTEELRELIMTSPSAKLIWDLAATQGAESLYEDGIEKVKNGVTTVEELLRVASPRTGGT